MLLAYVESATILYGSNSVCKLTKFQHQGRRNFFPKQSAVNSVATAVRRIVFVNACNSRVIASWNRANTGWVIPHIIPTLDYKNRICTSGGHQNLQIGRMLDIDLISEPPPAPHPHMYVSKVWDLCGQKGQEANHIKLGSQDVTYLSLHPMPLPPRIMDKGQKLSFCPPLLCTSLF